MNFKERYQYNPKADLLGKGGFATVYKATDTLLNRVVAVKFYATGDDKHTLIAEISRAISLEHPNLCRYYDASVLEIPGFHGDVETLEVGIMEYLDGGDLKRYCLAHPDQQIKLLTDVLRGLAFLHKRGIIHRDLKPANILIKNTEDGPVAKITDFGISKEVGGSHTSSSLLMGTIEYMAPEQFNPSKYGIDGKINTNLDLWSFGLMVYELVTGTSLFGSRGGDNSAEQVMGNILNDDLIEDKIAHLPEPYRGVVSQCLIKDARQRVQSADELIAMLNGASAANFTTSVYETKDLTVLKPQFNDNAATKEMGRSPQINSGAAEIKKAPVYTWGHKALLIISAAIVCFCIWSLCTDNAGKSDSFIPSYLSIAFFGTICLAYTAFRISAAKLYKNNTDPNIPFPKTATIYTVTTILAGISTFILLAIGMALGNNIHNAIYYTLPAIPFLISLTYLLKLLANKGTSLILTKTTPAVAAVVFINYLSLAVLVLMIWPLYQHDQKMYDDGQKAYYDALHKGPPKGSRIDFYDDFSKPDEDWDLTSDTISVQSIANGKLTVIGVNNNFSIPAIRDFGVDCSKDFSCSVKAKWMKGDNDEAFGLIYCSASSDNLIYFFNITSDGSYSISSLQKDGWKDLVGWTESRYIHKGNAENLLALKKEDGQASFYINDHLVKKLSFSDGFGSEFGVQVDGTETIKFDDFKLTGTHK